MKELRDIVERLTAPAFGATQASRTYAVATVIEVRGSTFRRPGARMLIAADSRLVGSVSGGCLEADVCKRAERVMASGVPEVLTYDTTSDADIVWGLGLGCNGVVRILLEAVKADALPGWLPFVMQRLDRGEHATVATITNVSPNPATTAAAATTAAPTATTAETAAPVASPTLGQRVLLREDGTIAAADIADAAWLARVIDTTSRALEDRATRIISCTDADADAATGTEIEIFCETIKPPVPLVIFGSGDDAAAVCRVAKTLGWHVTIVDRRPSYLTPARLPEADVLTLCEPEHVKSTVPLSARSVAIVMTHNYLQDRAILEALLARGVSYIGQLGPRRRTERLLQEMADAGVEGASAYAAHKELPSFVHAPVGLDLGAETPEEIALAIVAEIQAVTTQHAAGFLKNRPGPIHLAAASPSTQAQQPAQAQQA